MILKHLVALSMGGGGFRMTGPGEPPTPGPGSDPELPEPPPREPMPIDPDPFPEYRDVPPVTPIDSGAWR